VSSRYTQNASWANDSVGDILNKLLLALEVASLDEQMIASDVLLY
jgi:hypothetical protein